MQFYHWSFLVLLLTAISASSYQLEDSVDDDRVLWLRSSGFPYNRKYNLFVGDDESESSESQVYILINQHYNKYYRIQQYSKYICILFFLQHTKMKLFSVNPLKVQFTGIVRYFFIQKNYVHGINNDS